MTTTTPRPDEGAATHLPTTIDPNNSDGSLDGGLGGEFDVCAASLHQFINEPVNQVYAINLIHFISQLSDSLVTACGGLLPLLAATTSPSVS